MKIFALQTNINVLRKAYIIQGEKELLVTHYHWISFVIYTYKHILLTVAAFSVYSLIIRYELFPLQYALVGMLLWLVYLGWTIINGFIRYKLNFVIVTTEKVVLIEQVSFFKQHVNPMHLDTIVSTDVNSQLLGLFRCGKVVINLTERTQYSSKQVLIEYIPDPNAVAGIIENAIVLDKKRASIDRGIRDQSTEISELQDRATVVTTDKPIEPKHIQTD